MSESAPELDLASIQRDKLAMLGQLTAGVAHELNNPVGYIASNLSTLQGYVERIMSLMGRIEHEAAQGPIDWPQLCQSHKWGLIAGDLPELLKETLEGCEHLKALVADLKTLGRTSASAELIDPNCCVISALNVLNHRIKHGFTVERRLGRLPALNLVRPQIIQAVTNLLHNGLQAMGEQGRLLVETTAAQDLVTIAIEDDGPGVSAEVMERIFQPYFTTKNASSGTGLGLAIVRRIMQDHGGEVRYRPGTILGGARFELSLRDHEPAP